MGAWTPPITPGFTCGIRRPGSPIPSNLMPTPGFEHYTHSADRVPRTCNRIAGRPTPDYGMTALPLRHVGEVMSLYHLK